MSEVSTAPTQTTATENSPTNSPQTTENSPTPAEVKKYKLKIDGKESEYDEAEVLRLASLGGGASKKFDEAAKARKQAEQALKMFREDPYGVAEKLGIDLDAISEERLYKKLMKESQDAQLSPAEKKARELEAELDKYRNKEKEEMTAKERQAQAKAEKHYEEHYEKVIADGLATAGLPKTASTMRSVANYLAKALDAGYDVDVSDVIPMVKKDYLNAIQELFGASDADTLISLLGDKKMNEVRRRDLEKLRGSQSTPPPPKKTTPTPPKEEEKLSSHDFREHMRKKMGLE